MAAALSYAVAGSGVANQLVTSGNCTLHASKRCLFSTRGFRCQAEKTNNSGETQPQNSSASPLSPSTPPVSPPPPPPAPKATKPNLADVFAFGGPGPERINGRLAMVGFVSAVAVEVASGQDLADQLAGGGGPWFLGTAAVLSLASLIPLLKGITAQARSGNLMSSDAELWNGRFAMLGLVALGFTEYLKGGPLV